jgi:hypothetical protein
MMGGYDEGMMGAIVWDMTEPILGPTTGQAIIGDYEVGAMIDRP